jgi:hypothetical protein
MNVVKISANGSLSPWGRGAKHEDYQLLRRG